MNKTILQSTLAALCLLGCARGAPLPIEDVPGRNINGAASSTQTAPESIFTGATQRRWVMERKLGSCILTQQYKIRADQVQPLTCFIENSHDQSDAFLSISSELIRLSGLRYKVNPGRLPSNFTMRTHDFGLGYGIYLYEDGSLVIRTPVRFDDSAEAASLPESIFEGSRLVTQQWIHDLQYKTNGYVYQIDVDKFNALADAIQNSDNPRALFIDFAKELLKYRGLSSTFDVDEGKIGEYCQIFRSNRRTHLIVGCDKPEHQDYGIKLTNDYFILLIIPVQNKPHVEPRVQPAPQVPSFWQSLFCGCTCPGYND